MDYPLHDMQAPFPPEVVMGAQCNICIDDFSVKNSTNFVIGSHETRTPPPPEFNTSANEHFPPFAPHVVDQIECPGGSLIMCACFNCRRKSTIIMHSGNEAEKGLMSVCTTCLQIMPTHGTDQA